MTRPTLSNRHIWQVVYPVLISLLMENLIGMTDTAFMGRVGEVELGAAALGGVFYLVFFMVAFGFSLGAQILIGRRNGEGKFRDIGALFQQGIFFLLGVAALMFLFSKLFSGTILRQVIDSPEVSRATEQYIHWRVYGFFFAFISLMFRAFYVGITRTKILTLNSLVMVLSNVALNYVLVFGKLGCPALGIAGAAMGSSIAEAISALFFVLYTYFKVDWTRYRLFHFIGFSRSLLGHMLGVSVWTMLQSFTSVAVWFVFFVVIEHLGERSLAVSNIVRNVSALAFLVLQSFASTASSLVSNLMGAGRSDQVLYTSRRIIRLCYGIILPLMAFMLLFPSVLLRLYTDDPELMAAAVASMRVMASSYLIATPALILFNTVSGTGNTRSAMWMEFAALIIYVIFVGYVAVVRRADVAVCWTSEHVYAICVLVFSYLYLKKAQWQSKKI